MKNISFVIIILFLASCSGIRTRDTGLGWAIYAVQHPEFNCDRFISKVQGNEKLHISFLYNTFGADFRCLTQIKEKTNLGSVYIHLTNAVCQRKNNCEDTEFLYRRKVEDVERYIQDSETWYMMAFIDYMTGARQFINSLPEDVECYISPELESNLSPKALEKLLRDLAPSFPRCTMVANPNKRGEYSPETVTEFHHEPNEGPCIANNDGVSLSLEGYPDWAGGPSWVKSELDTYLNISTQCEKQYIWHHSFNCIDSTEFVPPRQRRCRLNEKIFDLF